MNKKIIIGAALALCFLLAGLSFYGVYASSQKITPQNGDVFLAVDDRMVVYNGELFRNQSEGWSYNPVDNLLTLNGFTGSKITARGLDINLVLKGENRLASNTDSCLYSDGSITVSGEGALSLDNESSDGLTLDGICGLKGVTINGGMLAVRNRSSQSSGGIYSQRKITINGGTVQVVSGGNQKALPLCSEGDIEINGGTVSLYVSAAEATGSYARSNHVINGGVVVVSIPNAGRACGIAGGAVNAIYKGTVKIDTNSTLQGGNRCSYALFSDGDIVVERGALELTATGEEYTRGAFAGGSILINGGIVNANIVSDKASSGALAAGNAIQVVPGMIIRQGNNPQETQPAQDPFGGSQLFVQQLENGVTGFRQQITSNCLFISWS